MSIKTGWPPVLHRREQERREKLRRRLGDFATTVLRVSKAEASKERVKFSKPHWPPIISLEEKERRKLYGEPRGKYISSNYPIHEPAVASKNENVPPCTSLAVLPPPSAVAETALRWVLRATAWRRKKRA
ncbi:unnamed protein product [Leuciscus chuanchicus]